MIRRRNVRGLGYSPGDCNGPYRMQADGSWLYDNACNAPAASAPAPTAAPSSTGQSGAATTYLTYQQFQSLYGFENCDPKDSACVMRNTQRSVAAQDAWAAAGGRVPAGTTVNFTPDTSAAALQAFMSNQPLTASPGGGGGTSINSQPAQSTAQMEATYYAKLPGTTAAQQVAAVSAVKAGTLSLQNTSRNSANFQVGDNFKLTISGASPNQPLYVSGSQGGQSFGPSQQGQTDASGTFSLAGVMTADSLGQWIEVWAVGSPTNTTGTVSFQVVSSADTTTSGEAAGTTTGSGDSSNSTGAEVVGGSALDQIISALPASLQPIAQSIANTVTGIPTWGWIAAAAALLLYLHSRKDK